MLRIMSRYELSSDSLSAPDRVAKVTNLIKIPTSQLRNDVINTEDTRKENVIVKADPNKSDMNHPHNSKEISSIQAPMIKKERDSPTTTCQLQASSETSPFGRKQSFPPADKDNFEQARVQVMKTIESLSRLNPGVLPALNGLGFSSASLPDPKQFFSRIYGNQGVLLPQSREAAIERFSGFVRNPTFRRGKDMSSILSNIRSLPIGSLGEQPTALLSESDNANYSDNTGSKSKIGSETTCVMDSVTLSKAVSISGEKGEKVSSEPLDLSQNRPDPALPSESLQTVERDRNENKSLSNMLVESATKVNTGIQAKPSPTVVGETIKIKTEVLDEKDDQRKTFMGSTERPGNTADETQLKNTDTRPLPFIIPNGTNQRLPETLLPLSNTWVDLQGSICNPPIFLPPNAFGYFPRNPLESLATFHSAKLAQNSHAAGIAAGLSQWVNLSLDVARAVQQIRQVPGAAEEAIGCESSRKRKYKEDENISAHGKVASEASGNSFGKPESTKRIRLHESLSDGVQRSASDDQPRRGQLDTEKKHKRVLERRNSAPSSSVVNQILRLEDEKRITPVDLHSYTGCLPPHYLHLLQSSGNLPMTWPEHALREVADVYDSSRVKENTSLSQTELTNKIPELSSRIKSVNSYSKSHCATSPLSTDPSKCHSRVTGQKKEIWRPQSESEPRNSAEKSQSDRLNYFDENQRRKLIDYYQSIGHTSHTVGSPLGKHEAKHGPEKVKEASETESDDEDYIQTLQISEDEEEDEDLKTEMYERTRSVIQPTNQHESHIRFGEGQWRCMDNGLIHAFPSCNSSEATQKEVNKGQAGSTDWFNPPTKQACSVKDIVAQPINGTMRSFCTSKSLNTGHVINHISKDISSEFLPHDVIPGQEKCLGSIAPRMIQKSSTTQKTSKCPGCSGSRDKHCRGFQDDGTRKLLGDILRQSFGRDRKNTYLTTITNSKPRLVFSSDIADALPKAVDSTQPNLGVEEPKLITSSTEQSRRDVGHSLPLPNCSKENREARNCVVSMRKSEGKKLVNEKTDSPEKSSIHESLLSMPTTTTRGTGQRKDLSSYIPSSRHSSLHAKLEELLQKAVLSNETTKKAEKNSEMDETCKKSEVSSFRPQEEKSAMESNIKTECITQVRETSSPAQSTNKKSHIANYTLEEPRPRSRIVSPFADTESGRHVTKRNVAVIKPNQSLTEKAKQKDKIPAYTCPPKKRHIKRYSPEFYTRMQKDIAPNQNREVKSASPVNRSSCMPGQEEESLKNVRWCSPDRATSGKNPQNLRPKTILSYHFPRNMSSLRTSGSRAIMIENYRNYPRYVTSPRSDAVIVIESRLPGKLTDNREDERLEICDLEISDDEC